MGRIAFTLVLGLFSLFWAAPASALSPPPPEKAEVVYSNAGRILAIKADGSERRTIASRLDEIRNTDLGYTDPAVSPDGSKLAFVNRRKGDDPYYMADILVADIDGSNRKKVLAGDRNNFYSSPSWTPDGKRLIAAYYSINGWKQTGGIVSVKPDGSDRKAIFRLKTRIIKKDWESASAVMNPVMSPDGRKVLFVRLKERIYDDSGNLEVLNLATRKTKVLARYSLGGSWSPDGSRIVHADSASGDDEICGMDSCERGGKLFVIGAEGGGTRQLIKGEGFESAPDWSADGSRIVFQSNRNMPDSPDAFEVYSVDADGSCLTWLTNGTPASTAPVWSMTENEQTYPDGCGSKDRAPLIEIPDPAKALTRFAPQVWLGDEFRGLLVSDWIGQRAIQGLSLQYTALNYGDCSRFAPSGCGLQLQTIEYPTCTLERGFAAEVLGSRSTRVLRGVPYVRGDGDGAAYSWFMSGESVIVIWRDDSSPRPTWKQLGLGLKPVGAEEPPREMPAPSLPAADVRRMKQVVSAMARNDSVAGTARKFRMSRRDVRANLRMNRLLKKIGPVQTMKCPKLPSGG